MSWILSITVALPAEARGKVVHWANDWLQCLGTTTLPRYPNAVVTMGDDGSYAVGDSITYACNSGYFFQNSIVCQCITMNSADSWSCNPALDSNPCTGKIIYKLSILSSQFLQLNVAILMHDSITPHPLKLIYCISFFNFDHAMCTGQQIQNHTIRHLRLKNTWSVLCDLENAWR